MIPAGTGSFMSRMRQVATERDRDMLDKDKAASALESEATESSAAEAVEQTEVA